MMASKLKKIKPKYLLIFCILILAFRLRLYQIQTPLADWHSWRQTDTSAVSRNFLKQGFDILHPRFDDLSSVPSGKENPQGYRFVEFPFYNLIQAAVAKTFTQESLEWWGRIISIAFSLGSTFLLYLIAKKYLGLAGGLLASFFFAVLPYNIFYSRTVLPEPMMVFTSLSMIYFFDKWLEGRRLSFIFYLLSFISACICFLLKPFTLFLALPMIYLVWRKWGFGLFKKPSLYFYALFSLIPFIAWRVWMGQFPEGIPAYTWLFNDQGIRFKGAFFRWIFAERLGRLILGFWGLVPFTLGILARPGRKEGWLFYWWMVSILAYFTVFAGGNVRHDYYQTIAIPIICIFLAKGVAFLASPKVFNKLVSWTLLFVCLLFMLAFSWYEVRGYFNINHPEIVEAGKIVDRLTPEAAKVIAPYNGDTTFLYQTNRQGWPIVEKSIDYLISKGATHYVSVNFDGLTEELMEEFKILEEKDTFVIINLTSKK